MSHKLAPTEGSIEFKLPSADYYRPECELLGRPQEPGLPQDYPDGKSIEEWMQFNVSLNEKQNSFLTLDASAFSKMVGESLADEASAELIRHKLVRQWQFFFYQCAVQKRQADGAIKCALDIVAFLNDFVLRYDAFFRSTGPRFPLWPFRFSRHPALTDDISTLAKKGNLGGDVGLIIHKTAKWNPSDPATQIALRLITHIQCLRDQTEQVLQNYPAQKPYWSVAKSLEYPVESHESFDAWWKLAKAILGASYPGLDHPLLKSLATAKSNTKTKGQLRARIHLQIKRRMRSVFGIKNIPKKRPKSK